MNISIIVMVIIMGSFYPHNQDKDNKLDMAIVNAKIKKIAMLETLSADEKRINQIYLSGSAAAEDSLLIRRMAGYVLGDIMLSKIEKSRR